MSNISFVCCLAASPRSRGNVINVITGKFQFAQLYVLLCSINPHKFCETQNSTIGIVASLLAWKFLLRIRIFSGLFLHSGGRAYLQYLHLQYLLFLDNGYCKYLIHKRWCLLSSRPSVSCILAMTQCEMQNISCHLHHPHYDPCSVDCVIVCWTRGPSPALMLINLWILEFFNCNRDAFRNLIYTTGCPVKLSAPVLYL